MSDFICPKCGGFDYYFSNRTVMKGIGGIWGNRGGVKKFPVCKVCEEIMDVTEEAKSIAKKRWVRIVVFIAIGYFLLQLILALIVL